MSRRYDSVYSPRLATRGLYNHNRPVDQDVYTDTFIVPVEDEREEVYTETFDVSTPLSEPVDDEVEEVYTETYNVVSVSEYMNCNVPESHNSADEEEQPDEVYTETYTVPVEEVYNDANTDSGEEEHLEEILTETFTVPVEEEQPEEVHTDTFTVDSNLAPRPQDESDGSESEQVVTETFTMDSSLSPHRSISSLEQESEEVHAETYNIVESGWPPPRTISFEDYDYEPEEVYCETFVVDSSLSPGRSISSIRRETEEVHTETFPLTQSSDSTPCLSIASLEPEDVHIETYALDTGLMHQDSPTGTDDEVTEQIYTETYDVQDPDLTPRHSTSSTDSEKEDILFETFNQAREDLVIDVSLDTYLTPNQTSELADSSDEIIQTDPFPVNRVDSNSSGWEESQDKTNSDMSSDEHSACEVDVAENQDLRDPFCDPENPKVITFNDVSAAAYKVKSGVEKTPCTFSQMSRQYNMQLYFKKEFLQYTGSFKERGARYTLLQLNDAQRQKGVIAASAGNHALALSYHGHLLDIPVTVVMPIVAPMMKVEACKQFKAKVIIHGQHIGEAREHAMRLGKNKDLLYINGYDHPNILAGAGTMGLEILEQVPNVDACIIPVGGAGLIAGSAVALKTLKPSIKIIGVESERTCSLAPALKAGHPVFSPVAPTLADGLAVPVVGVNAFATAVPLIDKLVSVKESSIALAILRLIEQEKAVVEGAGATGLAAIIEGLLPELEGKCVVVPLCGGNIDTTALGRVIERGLAAEGRLIRFGVMVSDRPGGIAELTRRIADMGVSIKDILHERAWLKTDVFSVMVRCVVETRDMAHALELEAEMKKQYSHVEFWLNNDN